MGLALQPCENLQTSVWGVRYSLRCVYSAEATFFLFLAPETADVRQLLRICASFRERERTRVGLIYPISSPGVITPPCESFIYFD